MMELLHLQFTPQNENITNNTLFRNRCIMSMLTKDSNVLKIIALAICV